MIDEAWGAYLAAACNLEHLAPLVADRLISHHPEQLARLTWNSKEFWAAHTMTDALVRLNQSLPPKTLRAIARGFRVEAVVLMLRDPQENIENLTNIRNSDPRAYESIAATNVLVGLRSPRIAGPLLKEVSYNNWVWVSDTGAATVGGTVGSLLGGSGPVKIPDDLPPTALYRVTSQPGPQDRLVADGAIKMYVNRTQFESGRENVWDQRPEGYCYQCLRTGYIANLAGIPVEEATSFIDRNTPIRWSSATSLQAAVRRSLDLQLAGLKRITQQLIAAKLMQPEEIDVPLSIAVHITDSRTNTTVPLPQMQDQAFHLP